LRTWPSGPAQTGSRPVFTRPVWAEVSRRRLLENYRQLCRLAPDADLMAVVKANAYGHDVLQCAPILAEAGASWLGVTTTDEAVAVRAVCPTPRILIMSGIFPGEAGLVIDHALTPVVWEPWQLDLLEGEAMARRVNLPVHLEIDTGMARQGVSAVEDLLHRFQPAGRLQLEAVMTHFSTPENFSSISPNPQLAILEDAISRILAAGLRPKWLSAGNSSTLLAGEDKHALQKMALQAGIRLMLRPGLALYGYLDRFSRDGEPWQAEHHFLPVLSWKARITTLRTLQPGQTAGYGNTFVARRETRTALLPVGYADGLSRLLSNRGHVLIRGQKAPIAGRVSMDQTMVDVTNIAASSIGDEALLLGDSLDAWELADLEGTIPWEVLCAISARVPRIVV
jgi:alanine racemase